MITDTHAHVFHDDEVKYPILATAGARPAGQGTVEHLQRDMAEAGVERVVAIHTSMTYGFHHFLIADTAAACAPWMAGVCTLHPERPESPDLLRALVRDGNIRGMRSVPAGQPHRHLDYSVEKHLDDPRVSRLWITAQELGITINVLIRVALADELEAMLRKHPDLPVVLDHCMFAMGAEGMQGEALQRTLALARYPNLHAKLTWLVAGSERDGAPFDDTAPLLRAVVDAYGPDRCVWGSDFPTARYAPKTTYAEARALFPEAVGLSASEAEAIFATTPGRLWWGES